MSLSPPPPHVCTHVPFLLVCVVLRPVMTFALLPSSRPRFVSFVCSAVPENALLQCPPDLTAGQPRALPPVVIIARAQLSISNPLFCPALNLSVRATSIALSLLRPRSIISRAAAAARVVAAFRYSWAALLLLLHPPTHPPTQSAAHVPPAAGRRAWARAVACLASLIDPRSLSHTLSALTISL